MLRSMKRIPMVAAIILVALFLASGIVQAQASSTWSQTYIGYTSTSVIGTSDEGYAIGSSYWYTVEGKYTGSGSLVKVDFLLMKIDENGALEWTRRYDGGERGDAEACSLVQTSDGGFVLAGKISDNVRSYDSDAWLVKTDSSGNIEWQRTYKGSGVDFAGDVIQTGDGGYVIAGGSFTNSNAELMDFWLIKTDANGNVQWNQTYGTPENHEAAESLVEASDEGFVLAGKMYNVTGNSIWLVKVDSIGNMEWNQTFGGENGTDIGGSQALITTSDGGYALIGSKTQPIKTSYGAIQEGLLVKINPQGVEEWTQTFGTPGEDDNLRALVQTPDGGYALIGSKDLHGPKNRDAWLVKTEPDGEMLWNKTYGGPPNDFGQYLMDSGQGLVLAPDGGYAILAQMEYPNPSSTSGEVRTWLIKTNEFGAIPSVVQPDTWKPSASMPTPRASFGVAAVNGKLYAIGGSANDPEQGPVVLNINEEYDPVTDTWTIKAPMPTARQSFGIAVYQNKIYCIGGSTNGPMLAVNEVYDPTTNTWETKKPMPTARAALCANEVNNKIYLMGGEPKSTTNDAYDPSTDTWTTKTPIPIEAASAQSAVANDKIFLFGGLSNRSSNQIYDPASDTWATGTPIPIGVAEGAAVATTGVNAPVRIYVMGGDSVYVRNENTFGNVTDLNQVYNPETNTWSFAARLPTERRFFGLGNVNDTLYLLGGFPKVIGFLNTAYQYTPLRYGIPEQEHSPPLTPSPPSTTWSPHALWIMATIVTAIALLIVVLRKRKLNRKAAYISSRNQKT